MSGAMSNFAGELSQFMFPGDVRMRLLNQIEHGKVKRPRRTLLFGVAGIGKSTFAAMSERPIFIQTEDGLADIGVPRFPLAAKYDDVVAALAALYTETHDFRTVVIDSLDWLERLIFADVCRSQGCASIENIGYAKGYVFALTQWREILEGLSALRLERGMEVILIAHAKVERFENPETDPYDRYVPRLHKLATALVAEWCDEILFATYKVHTRKTGESFGQAKHRPVGTGERIIRTTERPSCLAKNRLNLPDELPLNYDVYASLVRGENVLNPEQE